MDMCYIDNCDLATQKSDYGVRARNRIGFTLICYRNLIVCIVYKCALINLLPNEALLES